MKKYEVISRYAVFSIKEGKEKKEYSLKKGDQVELPEEHLSTRTLIARKAIREIQTT